MKKAIFCIFLVLILAGGLFARGSSQASGGTTTLTVNTFAGDPYQAAWRVMFDKFEAANGVKIIHDAIPWETMGQKQILELSSNSGSYDVISVHPFWFEDLAANGYLVPIDDYCNASERAKYVESLLKLYEYKGKIYGLPDWIATQILGYRKDLFASAGISAPKNWADVVAAAEKLANSNMYGITFPGRKGGALAGIFMTNLLSNGGWIRDSNGKPTINTPAAIETAEYLQKLSKLAPSGYQNFHWDENGTVACNGRAAMILLMTGNVPWLEDPGRSQTVGKWEYIPISNKVNGGLVESYCWSVAKNTKNMSAATTLAKFLGDTEAQIYFTEKMGTAGATKAFYENATLAATHPELKAMNLAFQNSAPIPSWSTWSAEQEVLETGLQDLFNDRANVKSILDAAQAKMLENAK